MNTPGHYKIACPHCGVHIEFPHELMRTMSDCPDCGCTVALVIPGRPDTRVMPTLPAPPIPVVQQPQISAAYLVKKSAFAGSGCLVQGIGVILLFIFPIGTVIGVVLLLVGSAMAIKYACGQCGNPVADSGVRFCIACRCALKPRGFFS